MNIQELRDGLEELQKKGYVININDVVSENLKAHLQNCIKLYNKFNVHYNQEFHVQLHTGDGFKDYDEIESEVKEFFSQFDVNYRITQLIESINWNINSEYELRDNHEKKKMLENSGKNRLIELYPDRIIVKVSMEKDKYSATSWSNCSYEIRHNLKELFMLVLRANLDLSYLKYTMDDKDFKSYLDNGFTVKIFKNGKIEITGDERGIRQINNIVFDHFRNKNDILVVKR